MTFFELAAAVTVGNMVSAFALMAINHFGGGEEE